MFKMLSMLFSVMSMIGILLSVKYVNKIRLPDQGQILQQLGAAAGKQGDAIGLIAGQKGAAPGQNTMNGGFNLMSLLSGGTPTLTAPTATTTPPVPAEPTVPDGPMTAICSTGGKDNQDDSADTEVKELPPGAQATFVDGRLQIYYPNGKNK